MTLIVITLLFFVFLPLICHHSVSVPPVYIAPVREEEDEEEVEQVVKETPEQVFKKYTTEFPAAWNKKEQQLYVKIREALKRDKGKGITEKEWEWYDSQRILIAKKRAENSQETKQTAAKKRNGARIELEISGV